MLEEVRKSGTAWMLVLRPDVIPHVYRDHRQLAMFVDDDVQAIGKRSLDVPYFHG